MCQVSVCRTTGSLVIIITTNVYFHTFRSCSNTSSIKTGRRIQTVCFYLFCSCLAEKKTSATSLSLSSSSLSMSTFISPGAAAVRAASRLSEESKPSASTSSIVEKKTSATSSSVKPSSSALAVKPERSVETQKKEVKSTPSPVCCYFLR